MTAFDSCAHLRLLSSNRATPSRRQSGGPSLSPLLLHSHIYHDINYHHHHHQQHHQHQLKATPSSSTTASSNPSPSFPELTFPPQHLLTIPVLGALQLEYTPIANANNHGRGPQGKSSAPPTAREIDTPLTSFVSFRPTFRSVLSVAQLLQDPNMSLGTCAPVSILFCSQLQSPSASRCTHARIYAHTQPSLLFRISDRCLKC